MSRASFPCESPAGLHAVRKLRSPDQAGRQRCVHGLRALPRRGDRRALRPRGVRRRSPGCRTERSAGRRGRGGPGEPGSSLRDRTSPPPRTGAGTSGHGSSRRCSEGASKRSSTRVSPCSNRRRVCAYGSSSTSRIGGSCRSRPCPGSCSTAGGSAASWRFVDGLRWFVTSRWRAPRVHGRCRRPSASWWRSLRPRVCHRSTSRPSESAWKRPGVTWAGSRSSAWRR